MSHKTKRSTTQTAQQIFNEQVQAFPRKILVKTLIKKFSDGGLNDVDKIVEGLADHIIAGRTDKFRWDDESSIDRNIDLSFDDKDLALLENSYENFIDSLPEVIQDVSDSLSKSIHKRLRSEWKSQFNYQISEHIRFRLRLEERWHEGFTQLRMLLTCAREIGQSKHDQNRRSRSKRNIHLKEVLSRLHIRSCQVSAEIMCLIENGFADGAMARWRTLYEISIVSSIIAEGGDVVAKSYLDHQIVENRKALDEYRRTHAVLGFRPISKKQIDLIESEYELAIRIHGQNFSSTYGWAVKFLKNKRPNFSDLEHHVNQSSMRSFYKLASQSVHAGTRAIYFQMGLIGNSRDIIGGASNAGFADPGQNTALALTQITMLLFRGKMSLDDIIYIKTLQIMRDKAIKELVRADQRLLREENLNR